MDNIDIPKAPETPSAPKLQVTVATYARMQRDLETAKGRLAKAQEAVRICEHQLASVEPPAKLPG